jgi:DNA repair exonuclease SbcCD ATPase subunit
MNLNNLEIKNVGKIKHITMSLKDNGLIQITGKNRAGKTTLIRTIELLFKGGSMPQGMEGSEATESYIAGTFGDYTAKRVFENGKSSLELTENGVVKKKAQGFLDALVKGGICPDLMATKDQKEFRKELLKDSGVDFTETDKKIKDLEDDRRLKGREVKNFGEIQEVEEVEKVNVEDLLGEKNRITRENDKNKREYNEAISLHSAEVEENNNYRNSMTAQIAEWKETQEKNNLEIKELQEKINKFKNSNEEIKNNMEVLELEINKTPILKYQPDSVVGEPKLIETQSIDKQITEASEINKKAQDYQNYLTKKQEKEQAEQEYKTMTQSIETLRKSKDKALNDLQLPVENLKITEDAVLFENTNYDMLSTSQKIELYCSLKLSRDPELKLMLINSGSEFDDENLEKMEKWGIANGILVMITIVRASYSSGDIIRIEEGEIKE